MATPSLRSTSALWSAVREEDSSTSQRSGKWALWLGFLKKVCVIGNFTGFWKPEGEDEIHTSFRSFGFWLRLSFSQPIQGIKIIPRSLFLLADVHPQWKMWGPFWPSFACWDAAVPARLLNKINQQVNKHQWKLHAGQLTSKAMFSDQTCVETVEILRVFFFPASSVFLCASKPEPYGTCDSPALSLCDACFSSPSNKGSCHKGHERPVETERTNEKQHHEWTKLLKIYLLVQFTAVSSLNEC